MSASCPNCLTVFVRTGAAYRRPGMPEWFCACGVAAWIAEQRAVELAPVPADEDAAQVLRACGVPMLGGPVEYHRGDAPEVLWSWWACAWSVRAVLAWDAAGFRYYGHGGAVATRLAVALVRGRLDPEWRAAGEVIDATTGAVAWADHLRTAGWPLGVPCKPETRTWTHNPSA